MREESFEIKSISYQIRIIEESDLDSLLLVKSDASVHSDRFRQQKNGVAVYLGAFINNYAIGYVLLSLENKEDVMPYTNREKCADMIDLLIIEPLRNYGVGSQLVLACEKCCRENGIPYLMSTRQIILLQRDYMKNWVIMQSAKYIWTGCMNIRTRQVIRDSMKTGALI